MIRFQKSIIRKAAPACTIFAVICVYTSAELFPPLRNLVMRSKSHSSCLRPVILIMRSTDEPNRIRQSEIHCAILARMPAEGVHERAFNCRSTSIYGISNVLKNENNNAPMRRFHVRTGKDELLFFETPRSKPK